MDFKGNKMILPSKELLSEVLNNQVDSFSCVNNILHIYFKNDKQQYFENIYELAHKCKEWILDNSDYEVIINDTTVYLDNSCSLLNEGGFYFNARFAAETDPESIFKACEWVRKETKWKH